MKKIISLLLAVLLLLTMASCGKKEAAPATEASTVPAEVPTELPTEVPTDPAPTEPDWEPGAARAGYGEAVYTTYAKGDTVTVIGLWKDYYVVKGEEVDLLIEKRFVRLNSEEPFESWNGYTKYGNQIFDNAYLEGEPIAKLYQNKKVTVLEAGEGWLYIEWDGGNGYVDVEKISRWPISSGNSDDGGSGGGGSSGGSSGGGTSGSAGGDINLDLVAYYGPDKSAMEDAGVVLADNVKGIICITIRDDEVKVTSVGEDECEIYLDGYTAVVPRWLLHMEGDAEYETWTGYARWATVVYEEYQMRNEKQKLNTNTQVLVLDELPGCYVVEIEDEIGYVKLDKISKYRIKSSSGSSDDGSGGGSGGSSGGSGGSSGGIWTNPIV